MMKKVAVIGAGAAGINAARHLKERQDVFDFTVFEQTNSVGGTWFYTDHVGVNPYTGIPIHSSMYCDLRTNLPIECMAFPGFPFPSPKAGQSFAHHSVILKYLESFCSHHQLEKFIKYNKRVTEVKPILKGQSISWDVYVEDIHDKEIFHHSFDAVMICTGRYSTPMVPPLPGIEKYAGRVTHSHDYRTAHSFTGETVLVLGAGPSGIDISLEIATVAKRVYLCHNQLSQLKKDFPATICQEAGILRFDGGHTVVLKNGKTISATCVVLCTGYKMTYRFLSAECRVTTDENVVFPLYKHMFHADFPSLAFIGLPMRVIPFLVMDYQNRFFLSALDGSVKLPSCSDMRLQATIDLENHINAGHAKRHFHCLPNRKMWNYLEDIANICGLHKVPQYVKDLYDITSKEREYNCKYKDIKIKLLDDGTVRYCY
ncbi:uncharacterized protein LOC135377864 [Ornithodoros turicata]|uniref:uncharacterized protein LOC135377864 n=1 Tax=Ornithodoros turicata TaxID=34597 RepID=UPI00313A1CED